MINSLAIQIYLQDIGQEYLTEYQFDTLCLDGKRRKFRFDFKIWGYKIGIEFDGKVWQKGRHTTPTGFARDCDKVNLAQLNGYICLRYNIINLKDGFDIIKRDIEIAKKVLDERGIA